MAPFHTQNATRRASQCGIKNLVNKKCFYRIYCSLCFSLSATGSRAGGCLPLYSNSGSRGPDRQEGPAHQTTRPLRRSFHQGGFVSASRVLTSVRRVEKTQSNRP